MGVWAAPGGRETLQKDGGLRPPHYFGRFPGRPGPPRPPKSTISGLSNNQIFKTQVCSETKRPLHDPRRRLREGKRQLSHLLGGFARPRRTPGSFKGTPGSFKRTPGSFKRTPGSSKRTPGSFGRPGTPLDRPGPPRTSICTKSQPRRPILMPLRGGF